MASNALIYALEMGSLPCLQSLSFDWTYDPQDMNTTDRVVQALIDFAPGLRQLTLKAIHVLSAVCFPLMRVLINDVWPELTSLSLDFFHENAPGCDIYPEMVAGVKRNPGGGIAGIVAALELPGTAKQLTSLTLVCPLNIDFCSRLASAFTRGACPRLKEFVVHKDIYKCSIKEVKRALKGRAVVRAYGEESTWDM